MSSLIHFVDVARIGTELRPVCGAWSDDVTWTTVAGVVTCTACARLRRRGISAGDPQRRGDGASAPAAAGDGTPSR